MQRKPHFVLAAALCAAVSLGSLLVSAVPGRANLADVSAVSCPVVKLKHWQASSQEEKMAFLFGFASMLEMERYWQHGKNLPISDSINQSWVRGLSGKTLGDIVRAVDKYIEEYPDRLDESLLELMGKMYVRPALNPAEKHEAGERYEKIRKNR